MKRTTAALLAIFFLAGCSESQPGVNDVEDVERDTSYTAEVDADTGTVILPLDRYLMTRHERGLEHAAGVLMTELCVVDKGYPGIWTHPGEPNSEEWYSYGRWNLENAQKYGYSPVPTEVEEYQLSSNQWAKEYSDEINTPEYDKAVDECAQSEDHRSINALDLELELPADLRTGQVAASYNLMLETPEADAVFSEWESCLTEAGLERDLAVSPFAIKGVSFDEPDENSIKAAVADVACKEKTNFIQRLADIEASFQGPVVKKYEAELVAHRDKLDEIMANVYDYLDTNTAKGEALWKP